MITVQYAKAFPDMRINAVEPGYTATDLKAAPGTQTVEEGAEIIVRMAQIGPDGPTGGYFDAEATTPGKRGWSQCGAQPPREFVVALPASPARGQDHPLDAGRGIRGKLGRGFPRVAVQRRANHARAWHWAALRRGEPAEHSQTRGHVPGRQADAHPAVAIRGGAPQRLVPIARHQHRGHELSREQASLPARRPARPPAR